jgi:5-methylcytosine-specific restriction endonuclease McrA
VSYILDLMRGTLEPHPDRISLERYAQESSYVPRYLSRVVKDKALVVYHVLFHLSWFETGKGEIVVPWVRVGSFIRSEQGNIIDNLTTVKRRLPDLFTHKCIAVNRQRGSANEIAVHLPSDIPACRQLIDREEREAFAEAEQKDERDYYNDAERRLVILARDGHTCVYCTAVLSEDSFVLDHLLPVARGGTNKKHNLVAACESCNGRRSESEPVQFLRENYRQQLLTQNEFLRQKDYIERLLAEGAG